jgi:hypothetical protein
MSSGVTLVDEAPASAEVTPEAPPRPSRLGDLFALAFGMAMTLAVQGYHFGTSNHTVYLLDPLRRAFPGTLARDWFTSQTLQYHAIFGLISAWLYELGVIEPAFLVSYLVLTLLLNVAWLMIVRAVGGSVMSFVLSIVLFHISAGGNGLGVYQFLQASSMLPSNVANVAMLWAIALWMTGRGAWAGLALGIAGLFHLNHAIAGAGLWGFLWLWQAFQPTHPRLRLSWRPHLLGTAGVMLGMVNIVWAWRATTGHSNAMPLPEFVDLYVRLRHPHHYDPSSWPMALWISFLWPLPLAAVAWRWRARSSQAVGWARLEAERASVGLAGMLAVALVGAGIFYLNEALIQMSLWRFSIHLKVLSCVGASVLLWEELEPWRRWVRASIVGIPIVMAAAIALNGALPTAADLFLRGNRGPITIMMGLCALAAGYGYIESERLRRVYHGVGVVGLIMLLFIGQGRWLGLDMLPLEKREYVDLCIWASDPAHTDPNGIVLVPPDELGFRLNARRAIVVNFKGVPQLSGEMIEWRKRLERVLDLDSLASLPHGDWSKTNKAVRQRYDELPASHLLAVANEYGARYIVVRRLLADAPQARLIYEDGGYFLYDLGG